MDEPSIISKVQTVEEKLDDFMNESHTRNEKIETINTKVESIGKKVESISQATHENTSVLRDIRRWLKGDKEGEVEGIITEHKKMWLHHVKYLAENGPEKWEQIQKYLNLIDSLILISKVLGVVTVAEFFGIAVLIWKTFFAQ